MTKSAAAISGVSKDLNRARPTLVKREASNSTEDRHVPAPTDPKDLESAVVESVRIGQPVIGENPTCLEAKDVYGIVAKYIQGLKNENGHVLNFDECDEKVKQIMERLAGPPYVVSCFTLAIQTLNIHHVDQVIAQWKSIEESIVSQMREKHVPGLAGLEKATPDELVFCCLAPYLEALRVMCTIGLNPWRDRYWMGLVSKGLLNVAPKPAKSNRRTFVTRWGFRFKLPCFMLARALCMETGMPFVIIRSLEALLAPYSYDRLPRMFALAFLAELVSPRSSWVREWMTDDLHLCHTWPSKHPGGTLSSRYAHVGFAIDEVDEPGGSPKADVNADVSRKDLSTSADDPSSKNVVSAGNNSLLEHDDSAGDDDDLRTGQMVPDYSFDAYLDSESSIVLSENQNERVRVSVALSLDDSKRHYERRPLAYRLIEKAAKLYSDSSARGCPMRTVIIIGTPFDCCFDHREYLDLFSEACRRADKKYPGHCYEDLVIDAPLKGGVRNNQGFPISRNIPVNEGIPSTGSLPLRQPRPYAVFCVFSGSPIWQSCLAEQAIDQGYDCDMEDFLVEYFLPGLKYRSREGIMGVKGRWKAGDGKDAEDSASEEDSDSEEDSEDHEK